jgi:hypothetical protein
MDGKTVSLQETFKVLCDVLQVKPDDLARAFKVDAAVLVTLEKG